MGNGDAGPDPRFSSKGWARLGVSSLAPPGPTASWWFDFPWALLVKPTHSGQLPQSPSSPLLPSELAVFTGDRKTEGPASHPSTQEHGQETWPRRAWSCGPRMSSGDPDTCLPFCPSPRPRKGGMKPPHVTPGSPIPPPVQREAALLTGLQEPGAGVQRIWRGSALCPPCSCRMAHRRPCCGWIVLVTWGQQWVWKKPRLAGPAQMSM